VPPRSPADPSRMAHLPARIGLIPASAVAS
jgi:hypothetical protein